MNNTETENNPTELTIEYDSRKESEHVVDDTDNAKSFVKVESHEVKFEEDNNEVKMTESQTYQIEEKIDNTENNEKINENNVDHVEIKEEEVKSEEIHHEEVNIHKVEEAEVKVEKSEEYVKVEHKEELHADSNSMVFVTNEHKVEEEILTEKVEINESKKEIENVVVVDEAVPMEENNQEKESPPENKETVSQKVDEIIEIETIQTVEIKKEQTISNDKHTKEEIVLTSHKEIDVSKIKLSAETEKQEILTEISVEHKPSKSPQKKEKGFIETFLPSLVYFTGGIIVSYFVYRKFSH
jgi:hypothetical protein